MCQILIFCFKTWKSLKKDIFLGNFGEKKRTKLHWIIIQTKYITYWMPLGLTKKRKHPNHKCRRNRKTLPSNQALDFWCNIHLVPPSAQEGNFPEEFTKWKVVGKIVKTSSVQQNLGSNHRTELAWFAFWCILNWDLLY